MEKLNKKKQLNCHYSKSLQPKVFTNNYTLSRIKRYFFLAYIYIRKRKKFLTQLYSFDTLIYIKYALASKHLYTSEKTLGVFLIIIIRSPLIVWWISLRSTLAVLPVLIICIIWIGWWWVLLVTLLISCLIGILTALKLLLRLVRCRRAAILVCSWLSWRRTYIYFCLLWRCCFTV